MPLIELNRFLTTEEVCHEYRLPAALADELLPKLPVVVVEKDGTRIHLESDVDQFLCNFSRTLRGGGDTAHCQPAVINGPHLTEAEQNILEALGGGKLSGAEIARRAGYPYNSNLKGTLSSLVKRGILVNDRPGYRQP